MRIIVVLINNNELGKISKEQRAGGWDKWATDLVNPNFAAYATSCGGLGLKVTKLDELEVAMTKLISHTGPGLLEIHADVALI